MLLSLWGVALWSVPISIFQGICPQSPWGPLALMASILSIPLNTLVSLPSGPDELLNGGGHPLWL